MGCIIIGASSVAQLEDNLENFEKGPLPEEMLTAFDKAWLTAQGICSPYFL